MVPFPGYLCPIGSDEWKMIGILYEEAKYIISSKLLSKSENPWVFGCNSPIPFAPNSKHLLISSIACFPHKGFTLHKGIKFPLDFFEISKL